MGRNARRTKRISSPVKGKGPGAQGRARHGDRCDGCGRGRRYGSDPPAPAGNRRDERRTCVTGCDASPAQRRRRACRRRSLPSTAPTRGTSSAESSTGAGATRGRSSWFASRAEAARDRNQDGHSANRDSMYEEMLQIGAFLRSVDRAWLADESVYVLLPESDRAMGEAFLTRVRRLAPEVLPDEGRQAGRVPAGRLHERRAAREAAWTAAHGNAERRRDGTGDPPARDRSPAAADRGDDVTRSRGSSGRCRPSAGVTCA